MYHAFPERIPGSSVETAPSNEKPLGLGATAQREVFRAGSALATRRGSRVGAPQFSIY